MRKRKGLMADSVAAVLLAALVLAATGVAHTGSVYYVQKWKSTERNQNYGFGSDVPGSAFRDRIENGAQQWNALAGNMQFFRGNVNVTWNFESGCQAAGQNSIHYGAIDGGTVPGGGFSVWAETTTCVYTSDTTKIANFRMRFDKDEVWYTGTGDTPDFSVDTWGTATHEFGHATGFGRGSAPDHFATSAQECQVSPKQTMCPSEPLGENYFRSLEEHDKHTFNNIYN